MIKFDDLGPEKLIEVYDPKLQLHGFLVIDNTILGPAKGGLRITPTVTLEEVARLARIMTYKCALAELPFGGGKSGIRADTKKISREQKFELIRAFARSIKSLSPSEYIAGPDVGTGEAEMAEFIKANGSKKSATGKPLKMGGLPHELGSTGFGIAQAALVATQFLKIPIKGAKVAIGGFGNVGQFAAKYLFQLGAKIVAVSDSAGTIYNPTGVDVKKLLKVKEKTGSVTKYQNGQVFGGGEIFFLPSDILIPAALGDVITAKNVDKVRAKIIVEGANLPVTEAAEEILYKRGVLAVPDFVANAGGVISSYAEYRGYNPKQMFEEVSRKVVKNTKLVLEKSKKEKITPQAAALKIALERLKAKEK